MEIHPADNVNVIQLLTSTIREGAQKAKSLSSACIYRVPKQLRKMNESAYTPQCIAIGPLHRNDPHRQTLMQHVKMSYTNDLLCRMTEVMENQEAEQKKILQDCVAAMEKSIDDAKKCYGEEVALDAEMMLVDGCFILEFIYKFKLYPWSTGYPQTIIFAFEQCSPGISQHFTSYAALMDMLVNSDNDVQVLEKAGVVDNWLGASEDVTDLFNKLVKEAFSDDEFLFGDACNRATMYSKRFWPKNMAYLRHQYFASPWTCIAFCLGLVYFGLAIAQLIISIYIK